MKGRRDDGHVAALLDRYRTGELEGPVRERVEAHLAVCPACTADLAALSEFAATVGRGYAAEETLAAASAPDWARQRQAILARSSGRAGDRRPWAARWGPQAALAVLALIAVGVLYNRGVQGPADAERALTPPTGEPRAAASRPAGPSATEPQAPPPGMDTRREAPERELGETTRDEAVTVAGTEAADDVAEVGVMEKAQADEKAAPDADSRFETRGRAALAGQDRLAASSALTFWRDSLAQGAVLARDRRAPLQALADSLAVLVATRP